MIVSTRHRPDLPSIEHKDRDGNTLDVDDCGDALFLVTNNDHHGNYLDLPTAKKLRDMLNQFIEREGT